MSATSGPICHLCGLVVPAVSFAPIATPEGGEGEEVGLCPDCLRKAEEQGLLAARIIPLTGGRRRPRPARRRRR